MEVVRILLPVCVVDEGVDGVMAGKAVRRVCFGKLSGERKRL